MAAFATGQTDPETYRSVNVAIDLLAETGPGLGRPLVDTLQGSSISNLKELRPRSGRDVAIHCARPSRSAARGRIRTSLTRRK